MNQPLQRIPTVSDEGQDAPPASKTPRLRSLSGGHRSDPGAPSFAPMAVSASTFENRRVERRSDHSLDIVPTHAERLFATSLAIAGNSLLAAALFTWPIRDPMHITATCMAISLILMAVAFKRIGTLTTLDVKQGELQRRGGLLFGTSAIRQRDSLAGVTAVQLLESSLLGDDADCPIYQVNLVRHDGTRVHVAPHVDGERARQTATTVAEMLGVNIIEDPDVMGTPA